MVELQFNEFQNSDADFTFIPYGLDSKVSKEAVKVHVLHGRKRDRKRTGPGPRQNQAGHEQLLEWSSGPVPLGKVRSAQGKGLHGVPRSGGTHAGYDVLAFQVQMPHGCQTPRRVNRNLSIDHRALRNPFLDGVRAGFDQLPTSKIRSVNYLVDHYVNRLGGSKFPRELLSSYWQDTACFKAFLAHAATLFLLETGQTPPVDVDELMCDALREVRGRLSYPDQCQADGTVLAVAMLANVEEGRIQTETAACHWRGLKQLLRFRGTHSSLRLHRNLHAMLLWREILTSNSYDFCIGHGIHDFPELQHCNEHLVKFFDNFADELSCGRAHGCPGSDVYPGGDFQNFITEILNRKIISYCDWTSSMERRSSMACLIYLAMLGVSAGVSADTRRTMERIQHEVVERDRWGQVTQPELLFVILHQTETEKEWRCQLLWQLSRCVFLTRTLAFKDWKTVRDMLSLYLGIEDGCDDQDKVLAAWKDLSERLLLEDACGKFHAEDWESLPS